jgi:LysR family glycine cleavage system transcriptional activator
MRLPPLNALRAFEVAARLGGFAVAAQELHVTPAAVSYQIKSLEDTLGMELFHRLPRGIQLTSAGQELLPDIAKGFANFARGVGGLRGGQLAGKLTINVAPSIATLWLVPRLGHFTQSFPDIRLRVLASGEPPDLNAGLVDVRIAYGIGSYPGLKATLLMHDTIFPVCAPSLLNHQPLRRLSDIMHHTLLHDIDVDEGEPTMTWARWLRDVGLSGSVLGNSIEFGDSILLTEAAVRGQGVALGRQSLVQDHLKLGRLVRPLKEFKQGDYSYYSVTTEAGSERPRVRVFLDWLHDQAALDAPGSAFA